MHTEDDFQRGLDADPFDWQLRLVFADWLDEQGDPRAAGYRELGRLRRNPLATKDYRPLWYFGTEGSTNTHSPDFMTKYGCCLLPDKWLGQIPSIVDNAVMFLYWRYNHTRRLIEDAAAHAFTLLTATEDNSEKYT